MGIFMLSISLSNPFYEITIKKYYKMTIFFEIFFRTIIFFLSIFIILIGLFLESVLV